MNSSRYIDPAYTARYVEAEWGDFLLKHARFPRGLGAPFRFADRNVAFYSEVVRMMKENLVKLPGFALFRVADVGCASGRLVREFCEAFAVVKEVRGYEPSANLCTLARQMVLGEALPDQLPISFLPTGGLLWVDVTPELRQALRSSPVHAKATFFEASVEAAQGTADYFDLVFCLNVLDRHPDPPDLVRVLHRMTRLGGLLCICSPLEWQETATAKEHWRDSVSDFLQPQLWGIVDERNIDYKFRVNSRRIVHYASHVVLAKRVA